MKRTNLPETTHTRVLHPTKGWRWVSVKRSRASALVDHIHRGGTADLKSLAAFLNH